MEFVDAMNALPANMSRRIALAPTGCWLWTGDRYENGYGRGWIGKGLSRQAHRAVYLVLVGQVPEGLVLDHLCRTKLCVNPRHLDVVTHRENILRGEGIAAINAVKTHCVHGHEFDEENTRWTRQGWRYCQRCRVETNQREYLRRKAAA